MKKWYVYAVSHKDGHKACFMIDAEDVREAFSLAYEMASGINSLRFPNPILEVWEHGFSTRDLSKAEEDDE